MKKSIKKVISFVLVCCVLATSLFVNVFAAETLGNPQRTVTDALLSLKVSNSTSANDIIEHVLNINGVSNASWDNNYGFQKVEATNGAIIKLNDVDVEHGVVPAYDGSITGVLNLTMNGLPVDVVVNLEIKSSYETINCTKLSTVKIVDNYTKFSALEGYDATADLVIIDMNSNYNIPSSFFGGENNTIKAVIVNGVVVNVLGDAFKLTNSLQAVVFNDGVQTFGGSSFYGSAVKYINFGSMDSTITFNGSSFAWSKLENIYIGGYSSIDMKDYSFAGTNFGMNQIYADVNTVNTVTDNTFGNIELTIVTKNSNVANKFNVKNVDNVIDKSQRVIFDYYNSIYSIKECNSLDELITLLNQISSNYEFTYSVSEVTGGYSVAISGMPDIFIYKLTQEDIFNKVEDTFSNLKITNNTSAEDILTAISSVSGVSSVKWNATHGFRKVQATNGAIIKLNGENVENGTVRGHQGFIDGVIEYSINGTNYYKIVKYVIEPAYETINCTKSTTVKIVDNYTAYNALEGYDATADLVIIDMNSNYNIPSSFFGGENNTVKAVIVNGIVVNVLSKAFRGSSALQAFVFNDGVENLGSESFYGTGLKFIDFGSTGTTLSFNNSSVFAWSQLENIYIGGYNSLAMNGYSFAGTAFGMTQIYVDVDTVTNIADNTFRPTNITIVTKNAQAASKFNVSNISNIIDLSADNFVELYFETKSILSSASADESVEIVKSLPSYSDNISVTAKETENGIEVCLDNIAYIIIPFTTFDGIRNNINKVLDDFIATNDTTPDEIIALVSKVPGVASVQWDTEFGFEKILATNGAIIKNDGEVVEDGIIRGHLGSITGAVLIETNFGDSIKEKICLDIDPSYADVNCHHSTTVKIQGDAAYSALEGYDSTADILVIDMNGYSSIPASFLGATSQNPNNTIKTIIVKGNGSPTNVLSNAFQHAKALRAVVFVDGVSAIGSFAFYASGLKYIDFGSADADLTFYHANAFSYSNLENMYIGGYNSLAMNGYSFAGTSFGMTQMYVDVDNVVNVEDNTFGNIDLTIIAKNADAANKFNITNVDKVIDLSKRTISSFDANCDFNVNILDLIRLKKALISNSEANIFDLNSDGNINSIDLISMTKELLGVPQNSNVIYSGTNTKISALSTIENFGDYSSVSDKSAETLRNQILSAEDTISVTGTTWYISADGDNRNAGNSPESPWKDLNAITAYDYKIKSGDAVLFRRGDVFRGNLISAKSGVSYGAYGTGDKPCIYGSKKNYANEIWVRTDVENLYKLVVDTPDIGMIIFNHGEAYGYKQLDGYEVCNSDYEFYHNKDEGLLYLYCSTGRPSDVFYDIEFSYNKPIIHVANEAENVYIENLTLKYTGGHGISVGKPVNNVVIKNCEIGWIGGSILRDDVRYGNGIEFYGQTNNCEISNCWIYQCYDAGITHQYNSDSVKMSAENILYSSNLIEFCSYSFEYYWGFKDEQGNNVDDEEVYMKDITIENNIMRFAGYGIGTVRPQSLNIGHVVTWNSSYNPNENFVIKNNIFDISTQNIFAFYTLDAQNPTMIGNTYIQTSNGRLGNLSVETLNPDDIIRLSLTEENVKSVDETGVLTIVD